MLSAIRLYQSFIASHPSTLRQAQGSGSANLRGNIISSLVLKQKTIPLKRDGNISNWPVQFILLVKNSRVYFISSLNIFTSSRMPSNSSPTTASPTPAGVPVKIISPIFTEKKLEI